MDIIIDKSYLHACKKVDLELMMKNHRLFMPDPLFYELITTDEEKRIKCFSKIPNIENPMGLVPRVGMLLRYENTYHKASYPVRKRQLTVNYTFNKNLSTGNFQFSEDQKKEREYQIEEVKEDTKSFIDRFLTIHEIFPSLKACKKAGIKSETENLIDRISKDSKFVKAVYAGTIDQSNLPIDIPPDQIGSKWIVYRWVQIQLIYALQLYSKYQGEMPNQVGDKFWVKAEHDLLDSQYIALACMADGIASVDQNIVDTYKLINAKGVVVPK